ncbi:amino acid permease [archaeon]|nr:amino acid permease [archaeon]
MSKLKRELGFLTLLFLSINAIMGTGIFFLPAVAAGIAGPASIISWVGMSLIAILISTYFAELISLFPTAGGIYEYSKQAFGRFVSFLVGWCGWIIANITIAMLLVGSVEYLAPQFDIMWKMAFAITMALVFNYICYKGIKISTLMLSGFAIATLSSLLIIIVPGAFKIVPSNFTPFFIAPAVSLVLATMYLSETFFGWETTTFLAEETKNPKKTLPKVLIISTVIVALLAIAVAVVTLGVIPWQEFSEASAPLAMVMNTLFGEKVAAILSILVFIAVAGTAASWIVATPRLLLAIARDNLFFPHLASIHPKNQTPHKAIKFQTFITISLIIVGYGTYLYLLEMLVPLVLFVYSVVVLSVTRMRKTHPHLKRSFTAPFGTVGPLFIVLFSLILVSQSSIGSISMALMFLGIGVCVYVLMGMYYDRAIIRTAHNVIAPFYLLTNRIWEPKITRQKLFKHLGEIKPGSVAFQLESDTAELTKDLAKHEKISEVYAIESAEAEYKITKKAVKDHKEVKVIFSAENKIPKEIKNVEIAVSEGGLSELNEPKPFLKALNKTMNNGGRISCVDYDSILWVIPARDWLNKDESIIKVFHDCGFQVQIKREKTVLWKNIFIYGKKIGKPK